MSIRRPGRSLGIAASLLLLCTGAVQAQSTSRKFEERSGTVELKMSMGTMSPAITLYFDDYGARIATTVRMKFAGKQIVQHAISIGDTTYQWSEETMEGTRKVKGGDGLNIPLTAYMNMDPARQRSLNYREIGTKKMLGKAATGFSVDTGGVTMKIWHWHSIPMLIEATRGKETVTLKATRIDAPGTVPARMFQLPTDVKFAEVEQEFAPENSGESNLNGAPSDQ